MEVTCLSCQTLYRVPDEKIPENGAKAKCPNCGQWILIPSVDKTQEASRSPVLPPGADYGQTMAYDFSQVDQSRTEIGILLEEISRKDPFLLEGYSYDLKDVGTGREFLLEKPEVVLGRSQGDILFGDPEVSRRHCLFKVFGDRFVVVDFQSTNGTFLGNRKIMTASLGIGERFRIGNTTLEVRVKKTGRNQGEP